MAEWKNAGDYEFFDAKLPARWAWEFLRRNPDYEVDYKSIPQRTKAQKERFEKESGVPVSRPLFPPSVVFGKKWGINGPLHDPDNNVTPDFALSLPEVPLLNQVVIYFDEPDGLGQASQRESFAVLVFQLWEDLDTQLRAAHQMLHKMQKERDLKPLARNFSPKQFATYLRLLDAKASAASTKAIVKYIGAYAKVADKTNADGEYQAQKRINRDHKKAKALVKCPWSILS